MTQRDMNGLTRATLGCAAALCLYSGVAAAGPWADAGDAQLRSDIEVLASARVIDNVTMQWPLPWGGILYRLDMPSALDGQPGYVRDAAARVLARGMAETETHSLSASVAVDATNGPGVVRGFDAGGRQDIQGQMSLGYQWDSTAVHIAAGAQSTGQKLLWPVLKANGEVGVFPAAQTLGWTTSQLSLVPGAQAKGHKDTQFMLLDGSYVAQRIGNVAVYAGTMTHWWGPGWISALSLSNNARPFPQVGVSRIDTTPFSSPWLSWIGAWQFEFLVGWLNGPRIAENTLWDGLRLSINPLPGLEIGVARVQQLCGTGHPCKPLAEWANIYNTTQNPGKDNGEGNIDIKYSGIMGGHAYEIYLQLMNEDSNPIVYSGTSHVFGASVWVPIRKVNMRFTAEFTSSIATKNIFSFGEYRYGYAYNDYKYVDGMRYRDRTLGFSLDSDSRLASLQVSWIAPNTSTYTFTYHHAWIGSANSIGANAVSTTPVTANIGEAKIGIPLSWGRLELTGRLQDDQPRPDKGFMAAIETRLAIDL